MLMTPAPTCLHEVGDVEHRLAKNLSPPPGLDLQEPALNGANAGCRDVAVLGGNCEALSPTYCSMARRSFRSSTRRPLSSAIFEHHLHTPACVSFSASMRESNSGPMSDTVARTVAPARQTRPTASWAGNWGRRVQAAFEDAEQLRSLGCRSG